MGSEQTPDAVVGVQTPAGDQVLGNLQTSAPAAVGACDSAQAAVGGAVEAWKKIFRQIQSHAWLFFFFDNKSTELGFNPHQRLK